MDGFEGSRLSATRRVRRLTIARLAEGAGVAASTVISWEQGRRSPNSDQLARLCLAIGCSADYLLGLHSAEDEDLLQRVKHDDMLRLIASEPKIHAAIATLLGTKNQKTEIDTK